MRSVTPTVHISARSTRRGTGLRELWVYRELFYFFAWRDIKVRYKQTVLGIGWAVLQPAITALIFTVFFNRVAKIDTGSVNIPYPVFAYLGLSYWNAFTGATSNISTSVLNNAGVITKVYFPRIIAPLSAAVLAVVDFFFAILVFIVLLFIFKVHANFIGLLWVIPSLGLLMFAAIALGLLFAALNVKYRDMRSALPFVIQAMFFMTPVIYPLSMIPERYKLLAFLNPATGPITSIKSIIFNQPVEWVGLGISLTVSILLFVIGFIAFKRAERRFPDYL